MNLAKHKEGILRERDRLNAEVEELNKRLQIQRIYTDEIEQKRTDSEKKNKELYKLLDVSSFSKRILGKTVTSNTFCMYLQETSSEAYQKIRMVDQLKLENTELTAANAAIMNDVKHLKGQVNLISKNKKIQFYDQLIYFQIETITAAKNTIQATLNTIHAKFDKTGHQLAVTSAKLTKVQADLEAMTALRNKCSMEFGQNVTQLKFKETECHRLAKENSQLTKNRDQLQKKLMQMEFSKADISQELMKFK